MGSEREINDEIAKLEDHRGDLVSIVENLSIIDPERSDFLCEIEELELKIEKLEKQLK